MNKILVIGDLMLDHYLEGKTTRISPEAPVPVVNIENERFSLGGAANVANNLNELGANVTLIGLTGEDESSKIFKKILKKKKIDFKILTNKTRTTTKKSRIISNSYQLVRVDFEQRNQITNDEVYQIISYLETVLFEISCIVISDYDKGFLTPELIEKIILLSNKNKIKVLVDPKSPPFSKFKNAYLIKPNKLEAKNETGIEIVDTNSFLKAAEIIQKNTNAENIIITLSEGGFGIYNPTLRKIIPTKAQQVYDVTGAGDTFMASLAYAISNNFELEKACYFANFSSGIVISKPGCVPITKIEIQNTWI